MARIVCVGCALVDIMVRGLEVKNGQINTRFNGAFHYVESLGLSLGGDALNEALVLAKLQSDVALVCGVGKDLAGEVIRRQAQKAGVDTEHFVVHPTAKTMLNTLLVQKDTEKYYFSEPNSPAMSFLAPAEAFRGASIVSLASLFMAPFDSLNVIATTIKNAKTAGAEVCADVILAPHSKLKKEELPGVYASLDYFFPNHLEAQALTGKDTPEEMADAFLRLGVKNIIIKMGGRGSYYKNAEESGYLPAFACRSVDSTGAGDSFIAGFLHARVQGRTLRESCRYGGAVASLVVQSVGATTGVKSRQQVEAVLLKDKKTGPAR